MAIIVRRPWDSQPQEAPTVRSSLRGVTGVWLGSQPRSLLVRNTATSTANSTVAFGPGPQGLAIQGAGGDSRKYVNLTTDVNTLLPNLDRGTIAIYRQCRDTTNRNSNIAAGTDGSGRISVIAPWSSGDIFFDWGSADNRLAVGGFVKTTKPEALVFTNGPAGGQRAYRNGALLGSGAQRTRSALTCGMNLAGQFDTFADDNEFIYLAVFSAEEWLPAEVARWSAPGQQYAETFEPRRIWVPVSAAAGGGYTLTLDAGSYALSGQSAALGVSRALSAAAGSYAVAGQAAALKASRALSAAAGSYAVAGQAASFRVARALTLAAGSYALSGSAATLAYTSGSTTYSLALDAGTYALSGAAAGLLVGRVLLPAVGAYSVSGKAAAMVYSGSTAIATMPPYITVYMWRRTA